jgi:uncharacterized FlgJ-related protein
MDTGSRFRHNLCLFFRQRKYAVEVTYILAAWKCTDRVQKFNSVYDVLQVYTLNTKFANQNAEPSNAKNATSPKGNQSIYTKACVHKLPLSTNST